MKGSDISEALGGVRQSLIEEARPGKGGATRRRGRQARWIIPTAAVLVLALGLGIVFGGGVPGGSLGGTSAAIFRPAYPRQHKYPGGMEMLPGWEARHDAWWKDQRAQQAYRGQGEALTDFYAATIPQFLSGAPGENRVYSPLNVYMALSMLAEVTEGSSRQQLLALLGADSIESLRNQAKAVWNANYKDDGAAASILAASLWMADALGYRSDTLRTLAETYYASSYRVAMGTDKADRALRAWLDRETGGLLKDQTGALRLDPRTVLAIATTVYFRAKWGQEFNSGSTAPGTFHAPAGDLECSFMHQTISSGTYYWAEHFAAVPKYLESGGSMWFFLPDEGVEAEALLDDPEWMALLLGAGEDWADQRILRINLSLPKFDVSSQIDLLGGLRALGVTDCLEAETADFSPLLEDFDEPVWLSAALHGARVAVDEEGVTAVAYTVLAAAGAGMPPDEEVDFVLDRPFLFAILGLDGQPLFVGVVNTP